MISFHVQTSISVTLKFQKTKSDAPVLIKLCLPVTSINLISFIRVFVSFLCCHGLWSFLRCLFLFVFCCFCCCLLSLFSLVFISGQNFTSSSSKDAAATTAVVELIKNNNCLVVTEIDDCILLTGIASPINFYRAVVNSTLKGFSQWSLFRLEMRLSKLFSA